MTTTWRKLKVKVATEIVEFLHDGSSTIEILGEPHSQSIEYDSTKEEGILQSIQMMDFQAKVAMLLRAELKRMGMLPPLPAERYRVEIDVVSRRPKKELPLIEVMKSVVDGINKEIIGNDRSIYECCITNAGPQNVQSRSTQPLDNLSVRIYPLSANTGSPVVSFSDVPIYIVPKEEPLLIDFDNDTRWEPYNWDLQKDVAETLQNDGMQLSGVGGPLQVNMTFIGGKVAGMDIDNMARVYLPILWNLGVNEEEVNAIHLYKQPVQGHQQSSTLIVLQ